MTDNINPDIDMARLVDEVNCEVAEITRAVLAPERWPEIVAEAEREVREREQRRMAPPKKVQEPKKQRKARALSAKARPDSIPQGSCRTGRLQSASIRSRPSKSRRLFCNHAAPSPSTSP
jgi:hypothetical protein